MCVLDNLSRGQVLRLDEKIDTSRRLLPAKVIIQEFFEDRSFVGVRLPDQPGRECRAMDAGTLSSCYKLDPT